MNQNAFIHNSPELHAYWAAAQEGQLLLPWCQHCGRTHWYPRGICPHCLSTDLVPRPASGHGVVYSWTANHSTKTPYVAALVTLDEGPHLLTRLVDAAPDGVAIGQRVVFCHVPRADHAPVPLFKLATAAA